MTAADLIALTPLIALALGGTVVMLAGALGARPSHLHGITVGSIGIAIAAAGVTRTGSAHDVTTLLRPYIYKARNNSSTARKETPGVMANLVGRALDWATKHERKRTSMR